MNPHTPPDNCATIYEGVTFILLSRQLSGGETGELTDPLTATEASHLTIHLWRKYDRENIQHGGDGLLSGLFHRQQGNHKETDRDNNHFRL
jgi:hypothetical protein